MRPCTQLQPFNRCFSLRIGWLLPQNEQTSQHWHGTQLLGIPAIEMFPFTIGQPTAERLVHVPNQVQRLA